MTAWPMAYVQLEWEQITFGKGEDVHAADLSFLRSANGPSNLIRSIKRNGKEQWIGLSKYAKKGGPTPYLALQ